MIQIIPMIEVYSVHVRLSGNSEWAREIAEKISKAPKEVRFALD